jgi:hypothetical protein
MKNNRKIYSSTYKHIFIEKQHIKIKIITYLSLITKAVNRQHVLLRCIEVYVHSRPWVSEQYFVSVHCFLKVVYKN